MRRRKELFIYLFCLLINIWNVEEKDIQAWFVSLDSDSHDNSRWESRRKYVLVPNVSSSKKTTFNQKIKHISNYIRKHVLRLSMFPQLYNIYNPCLGMCTNFQRITEVKQHVGKFILIWVILFRPHAVGIIQPSQSVVLRASH